ncbi:hypothetical protein, partial [Rhizobium sullae]
SSAAHVSLSSHLQLSNNRPEPNPVTSPQSQNPKVSASNQQSSQSGNLRASNFVASSAAALVQ